MTEKTTRPRTRKASTAKNTQVKEVEEVKVEQAPVTEEKIEKVEEKPARKKRKEIDRNELISCRSATDGLLIYISPRTKERYTWDDFGSVEDIEMGELITMKSSHPKFLTSVQLVIDDEEAAEYLGLNKIYEDMLKVDDLDELFDKKIDELATILPKLPEGLKKSVSNRARILVEADKLDSISKIKLIEQELGVDLQMFIN